MPLYLPDTSAWNRSTRLVDTWAELIQTGRIASCPPVVLELLYSTRTRTEYGELAAELGGLPQLELDRTACEEAAATQAKLAETSQHRGPTPVDLLVAAIARVNDTVLLHYDRHFDAIQRVTGQPMEWVARRGTLD